MRKFFLIVTGPKEYLEGGKKIEEIIITQEEIDAAREDGESDEDVINFFLNDSIMDWEQNWCKATVLDEASFLALNESSPDC